MQPQELESPALATASAHFMELLGLLLDGSPALIGLKDLDGAYVFANRELESLFALPAGGAVGRSDREFMTLGAATALAERDRQVAEHGEPTKSFDEFVVAGRRLGCATVRFPYRDGAGATIGIGFVAIEARDRGAAGRDDSLSMENARRTIAELRQAVAEMAHRAATDRLTGAWNRARIEEIASQELLRLDRYGHPVSVVFIDIDHFKRINDTHGHGAGDGVLRGFCAVVRTCIRSTDLLGRWGGEEFLLLLPNTGLTSARLLAERIRAALAQRRFGDVGIATASFGVAQGRAGEAWPALLERADAAMYRAKAAGRNRVEAEAGAEGVAEDGERLDAGFVRLVWRRAYESGHPVIDEQHRRLFEKANDLLSAVMNGQGKDDITPLVRDLMESNLIHFRAEESIFMASPFPGAEGHAGVHESLMARTQQLAAKYAADELALGELFHFLAYEVIARHILSEDRKFFPYLAAAEAERAAAA